MNNIELQKFVGYENISLSETMQKIDKNEKGILFIVNSKNIIIGCVTDGDIRRHLIRGGKITDKVIEAANRFPIIAKSLDEAKKSFCRKDFIAIPIVNNDGQIIDLFWGGDNDLDIIEHNELGIPVVINAGGKGTRLDPFTRVLPKPLIPIGDIPIIELIMKEYKSYGCNDFHIIVNYKKELMKAYFAESDNAFNITWHEEEKPLGTGGGLTLLQNKITDTFFFSNCDILLKANYEYILNFHKEQHNIITMVCAYKSIDLPYGIVKMGDNNSIEGMEEKPIFSYLINAGVYLVEPEVISDLKEKTAISFPDIIELERKKGKKVAVYPVSECDWMDMGQLPELNKMRMKLYGE